MTLHTVTVRVTPATFEEAIAEVEELEGDLGSGTVVVGPSGWTWTVNPYKLVISQDDQVEWVAEWEGCGSDPKIVVHRKGPRWPFPGVPHQGIPRAHSGQMMKEAEGHYVYGIKVICPDLGGVVIIDPDMDVLGPT